MCGRRSCALAQNRVVRHFNITQWNNSTSYNPRYNVAPYTVNAVVVARFDAPDAVASAMGEVQALRKEVVEQLAEEKNNELLTTIKKEAKQEEEDEEGQDEKAKVEVKEEIKVEIKEEDLEDELEMQQEMTAPHDTDGDDKPGEDDQGKGGDKGNGGDEEGKDKGGKEVMGKPTQLLAHALEELDALMRKMEQGAEQSPSRFAPEGAKLEIQMMQWGLVPAFCKTRKTGLTLINARSEKVFSSTIFKRLVFRNRCVAFGDGYFEWKKDEAGGKQPYFIHLPNNEPMLFACLHDTWTNPDVKDEAGNHEKVQSFTILTCPPAKSVRDIHHRMPVILRPEDVPKWLDVRSESVNNHEALAPLLRPYEGELVARMVSPDVGSIRSQGEHLVQPFDPSKVKKKTHGGMTVGAFHKFLAKPAKKPKRAERDGDAEEKEGKDEREADGGNPPKRQKL